MGAMLSPNVLRDMHKVIVDAYVLGTAEVPFTQTSNWNKAKDQSGDQSYPTVYWYMPLPLAPRIDERRNMFPRFRCVVDFVGQVEGQRTTGERDQKFNDMVMIAWDHFAMYHSRYVEPQTFTLDGQNYSILLTDGPLFERLYADEGGSMTTGCAMAFTIENRSPYDCTTLAAKFPSLYS